jgi:hypothetical protein
MYLSEPMNPSRQSFPFAASTLSLAGIILIVSSIIDYLILPVPYKPLDLQWRIALVPQIVDRGIIPMIGIALLFAGSWIRSTSTNSASAPSNKFLDIHFWSLVFSSILGFLFLALGILHLADVSKAKSQTLNQINQQAQQAEVQLESQIGSDEFQKQVAQRQEDIKKQLSPLLGDKTQLDAALQNDRLPQELKTILEQSKDDPKALDKFLSEQAKSLPDQLTGQLRERKQSLTQEANLTAWKSSSRVGISSVLLAIGYIVIGWTGLKSMMLKQSISQPVSMG